MKEPIFMSKAARLFKVSARIAVFGLMVLGLLTPGGYSLEVKKQKTTLSKDVYNQNIHYEFTRYLRLDRLYRSLFARKVRAQNINRFDEVPDSNFFENRHGRKRLSTSELERGYRETDGPDVSGALTITRGKFEGLTPGFFVRDSRGDEYLFKFDPFDYPEVVTGAEVVGSRFYHAVGYHVPQYTVVTFAPEQLVPAPDATIVDDTGFRKPLTPERLENHLLFLPMDPQGHYRVCASKILAGENKGFMSFLGRRKEDPDDPVDHEHRRELRALYVFSSWLNNFDIRESNTLDMLVTEDGRQFLKHYLIDFNCSLGANAGGPKPPMRSYEHILDYGETFKAFLTLGWREKPWQRKWREIGESVPYDSAIGYFDNRYFDPSKFKSQLPHYVFKNITRADGFWAAKIINQFSDEDIRSMVKAGMYSRREDEKIIAETLIERRDIITKYWFSRANPLDDFDYSSHTLTFKDLAADRGFEAAEDSRYIFEIYREAKKRKNRVSRLESGKSALKIEPHWFDGAERIFIYIYTFRGPERTKSPYVAVELTARGIVGISHQD